MATEFYIYTAEMKQNWEDYESLLGPAIKEALQEGSIQRAFSKDITFVNPRQREIFANYIQKNRLNSRWVDEHFSKLIASKDFPAKEFSVAITDAKRTIESNPGQARRILAAFDSLSTVERQSLSLTKLHKFEEIEALRDKIPPLEPDPELNQPKQSRFQQFIKCASQKIKSMIQ